MSQFITTILFDLNETLIFQARTERSHMASTYAELARHYWDVNFESFEAAWTGVHGRYAQQFQEGSRLLGKGDCAAAKEKLREPWYRENIAAIATELGLRAPNRLIEEVTWAFQDSWVGGLRMPDENRGILQRLVEAGYQLGVVTNFQQPDIVPDILADFQLGGFFKTVVVSASVGWRKPYPKLFERALQDLGVSRSPARVAYVGDNLEEDARGAARIGLRPILIDRKRQCPEPTEAFICIQSLTELPEAISKIKPIEHLPVGD